MSGTPIASAGPSRKGSFEDLSIFGSGSLNGDFDIKTMTDRSGYPAMEHKTQGWRAQSHLVYFCHPNAKDQANDMYKHLVRGGKIYVAGTGGKTG